MILHTRPAALLDQLPAERVLFIHAADDRTAPMSAVQSYARSRMGTALVVFPTGGHHPYLRQQVVTCAAIARFVDDRPA